MTLKHISQLQRLDKTLNDSGLEYHVRKCLGEKLLILKAPITTAADDKFCDIFPNFRQNQGMILHENRLPADDSHEISCLIGYFLKSG